MTTTRSRRTASLRMFALVAALLFAFSNVQGAFAATLQNGQFSNWRGCNLAGWTTSGNVSVVDGDEAGLLYADDCTAKVHVVKPSSGYQSVTSTLSQTFDVPVTQYQWSNLQFRIWAQSSNGATPGGTEPFYLPQTIKIKDSTGATIYSVSHNYHSNGYSAFAFSLSDYEGQQVTLEVSVSTNSLIAQAPNWASLYIDFVRVDVIGIDGRGAYGW